MALTYEGPCSEQLANESIETSSLLQVKITSTEEEKEKFRNRIALLKQEKAEAVIEKIALATKALNAAKLAENKNITSESKRRNGALQFLLDYENEKQRLANQRRLEAKQRRSEASTAARLKKIREKEAEKLPSKIDALIQQHSTVLTLKYRRCLCADEYGIIILNTDDWEKELRYFHSTVLPSKLSESEINQIDKLALGKLINEVVTSAPESPKPEIGNDMVGVDFETRCAESLKTLGWKTSLTKGSGDQGIDIIARKGEIVVVLQCKRYTGAVGNKAVQEVLGGKEMIKATFAAVVTNSTYTKSARQLAANSGVILMHFEQLFQLDEFISHK